MKRMLPVAWLVVLLASACTGGTPSDSAPPGSTPAASQPSSTDDPLPSWNEGTSKKAIRDFVARVTKDGSPGFVPVAERIATFDNDGTLWAEKPLPFQVAFALDSAKALAPQHPEWNTSRRSLPC